MAAKRAELDPIDRGRARRKEVPRRTLAEWSAPPGRLDPVAVLEKQAGSRIASLVPIRYGRMATSPFAFYRGAAAIMAGDLATLPRSGLVTQLCGDAHLANFGAYGTPERNLVFDVNDFDETLPGPFEWDVKRLAASFVIAGRGNGFVSRTNRKSVLALVNAYRDAMQRFASEPYLATWYARLTAATIADMLPHQAPRLRRNVKRVVTEDPEAQVGRLIEKVDGELRFRHHPPLLQRLRSLPDIDEAQLRQSVVRSMRRYRRSLAENRGRLLDRYELVDIAHKVVGVGSVGLRAFVLLMRGRSDADLLVLQSKQAEASVLEEHLGPSAFRSHGERVVQGQRLMQAASDIFLGWEMTPTGDSYIRQLRDWKMGVDVGQLRAPGLVTYARMCGWTLARAHARSGEPAEIAAYIGTGNRFDLAIADFAEAYADQNEADYRTFVEAIANGRISANAAD